jgi:hypothetical protein
MDLIDRYLHAIRRNLPPAKADDIAAELRDDLFSRVEDREERLGRPLNREETEALLKAFGHPLVVASRFRTHQHLIGPGLYPFYLSAMRIVLMIVVVIVAAISVAKAALGEGSALDAWAGGMSGIFNAVLVNAAIVTILFAVFERMGFTPGDRLDWRPDELPALVDKQPGPWESAFEVAMGIAFLLWWLGAFRLPIMAIDADFRLEPSPVFDQLFWPILIFASARLVHNLVQWLRPRWKGVRIVLGSATAIGGLAILAQVYQAGQWATVVSTGMAAEQVAKLQSSLDLSFRIAIVAIALIWICQAIAELWRLGRSRLAVTG